MIHGIVKVPRHTLHPTILFMSDYKMQLSINANEQSSAEVSRELV